MLRNAVRLAAGNLSGLHLHFSPATRRCYSAKGVGATAMIILSFEIMILRHALTEHNASNLNWFRNPNPARARGLSSESWGLLRSDERRRQMAMDKERVSARAALRRDGCFSKISRWPGVPEGGGCFSGFRPIRFAPSKSCARDAPATAPCVTLSGQPALYAVFRLPTLNRPDIIAVDSEALASIMFAPHLLLLDAQGAIKRDVSRDMVMFHGRDLRVLVRSHPDETYLVIASDSGLVGKSVSRIDDSISMFAAGGPGLMAMIHTGSESTDTLSFSHTGKVEITLSPLPH
jgi:hypothetical protein